MNENDVRRYIRGLNGLSTLPVLLAKIVKTCIDEDANAEELYKLITFDPALAERLLRSSNSVLLGHSGQIKDIHQAIMFLGFDRIKSLALGMTVISAFPSHGSFTAENLWIHSYEVAFLSSVLSDVIPMTLPGESFLAGLLHDIGRIVFYGMDPDQFMLIEATETMPDREIVVYGCTHAETGALLSESLGMSKELTDCIKYHHQPSAAKTSRSLVATVALAEALSRKISPRTEDDGIWSPEHDSLMQQYSLTSDDVNAAGDKLKAALPEIEGMFSTR
jgi:putative nucleotidyltransferase with HDIG domain